jgi:hypothetical protein
LEPAPEPVTTPETPATPEAPEAPVAPSPTAQRAPSSESKSLRELCRQHSEENWLDESRRRLTETFCGATLWFDGLFGGTAHVESARAVYGRVELSTLHTDFRGMDVNARVRLNYQLPNFERRFRLFLGRDDRDVAADRQEGFAIRSAVFGLQQQEEWLAGLGYSPPGRFLSRIDLGVGARLRTAPVAFVQARYRHNRFVGNLDVWRMRETVFWENRAGFGSTSSIDWDHVLRRDTLFRWGTVGTFSQGSKGLEWRSATVLYHNLRKLRAVAGELFVRGATSAEVPLREYGARGIYRQPIGGPYLFGDLIVGYTWPQERRDEPRKGSAMVGLGVELWFGQGTF